MIRQTDEVHGFTVDAVLVRLRLRDGHTVFPHCHNRRTDADHIDPYDHDHPDQSGETSTEKTAPSCRWHHRLKTTTRWRYRMIRAGCYQWISPYGRSYLRDEFGTHTLE